MATRAWGAGFSLLHNNYFCFWNTKEPSPDETGLLEVQAPLMKVRPLLKCCQGRMEISSFSWRWICQANTDVTTLLSSPVRRMVLIRNRCFQGFPGIRTTVSFTRTLAVPRHVSFSLLTSATGPDGAAAAGDVLCKTISKTTSVTNLLTHQRH